MINSGKYKLNSLNAGIQTVYKILHNCSYCGKNANERENGYVPQSYCFVYPPIISEEMYNEAMKTFGKRRKYNKVHSKKDYLCRGLLFGIDGIPFNVHSSHNTYAHIKYNIDGTVRTEISVDTIDEIIWNIAVNKRLLRPEKSVSEMDKQLNNKIVEEENKLTNLLLSIKADEEKIKRLEYRLIQGKLSEEDADMFETPIREELKAYNSNKGQIEARIRALKAQVSSLYSGDYKVSETSLNELSFEDKYKLVREEICNITIHRINGIYVIISVHTNIMSSPDLYKLNRYSKKLEQITQ